MSNKEAIHCPDWHVLHILLGVSPLFLFQSFKCTTPYKTGSLKYRPLFSTAWGG